MTRNITIVLSLCVGLTARPSARETRGVDETAPSMTVACYYFPNYHPTDARMNALKGDGWSEWKLVKDARPRFEGHQQPKTPLWGYTDESDPREMARKIDVAAQHGIDAFIFDWYWDNQGIYWEGGLERGFLRAPNNHRLQFAVMWAMWDFYDLFPHRREEGRKVLFPGNVTRETFRQACDYSIENYFKHPSYWKVDGRPYFSLYDLNKLVQSFGGTGPARAALDEFRASVKAAGFPGLHLNAVSRGLADPGVIVRTLGFDSVTSYVWVNHVKLPEAQTDYTLARDQYFAYWDDAERTFDVPYFPNVTMGWDCTPRVHAEEENWNSGHYPFMNTISGNTPERFREALQETRKRLLHRSGQRILTINCWNEWTEGSYLEPDTLHGTAYLEAVRDVFGDREEPTGSPDAGK